MEKKLLIFFKVNWILNVFYLFDMINIVNIKFLKI